MSAVRDVKVRTGKRDEPVVCESKGPSEGNSPREVNGRSAILGNVQKAECGNYSDETSGESHGACSDSRCLNDDVFLGSYRRGKKTGEEKTDESGL